MLDGRLDDELEEVFATGRSTSWNTSQSSEPEYGPTYETADEWRLVYEAAGELADEPAQRECDPAGTSHRARSRDRPTGADRV